LAQAPATTAWVCWPCCVVITPTGTTKFYCVLSVWIVCQPEWTCVWTQRTLDPDVHKVCLWFFWHLQLLPDENNFSLKKTFISYFVFFTVFSCFWPTCMINSLMLFTERSFFSRLFSCSVQKFIFFLTVFACCWLLIKLWTSAVVRSVKNVKC